MAMFTLGYLAWVAVLFMRTHGLNPGEVGTLIGPAITVGGIAGVLSGSFWCTWLTRRGHQDAALRTAIHALIVAIPLGVIAPLLSDWQLALPAITALIFFLTFPQGTNVAAFQLITPNQMRAQVSAVFLLVTNIFGLGFGATAVALLTDYVFRAAESVNYSLALASLLVGLPALVCLIVGLKPYRQSLKQSERWLSPATSADC